MEENNIQVPREIKKAEYTLRDISQLASLIINEFVASVMTNNPDMSLNQRDFDNAYGSTVTNAWSLWQLMKPNSSEVEFANTKYEMIREMMSEYGKAYTDFEYHTWLKVAFSNFSEQTKKTIDNRASIASDVLESEHFKERYPGILDANTFARLDSASSFGDCKEKRRLVYANFPVNESALRDIPVNNFSFRLDEVDLLFFDHLVAKGLRSMQGNSDRVLIVTCPYYEMIMHLALGSEASVARVLLKKDMAKLIDIETRKEYIDKKIEPMLTNISAVARKLCMFSDPFINVPGGKPSDTLVNQMDRLLVDRYKYNPTVTVTKLRRSIINGRRITRPDLIVYESKSEKLQAIFTASDVHMPDSALKRAEIMLPNTVLATLADIAMINIVGPVIKYHVGNNTRREIECSQYDADILVAKIVATEEEMEKLIRYESELAIEKAHRKSFNAKVLATYSLSGPEKATYLKHQRNSIKLPKVPKVKEATGKSKNPSKKQVSDANITREQIIEEKITVITPEEIAVKVLKERNAAIEEQVNLILKNHRVDEPAVLHVYEMFKLDLSTASSLKSLDKLDALSNFGQAVRVVLEDMGKSGLDTYHERCDYADFNAVFKGQHACIRKVIFDSDADKDALKRKIALKNSDLFPSLLQLRHHLFCWAMSVKNSADQGFLKELAGVGVHDLNQIIHLLVKEPEMKEIEIDMLIEYCKYPFRDRNVYTRAFLRFIAGTLTSSKEVSSVNAQLSKPSLEDVELLRKSAKRIFTGFHMALNPFWDPTTDVPRARGLAMPWDILIEQRSEIQHKIFRNNITSASNNLMSAEMPGELQRVVAEETSTRTDNEVGVLDNITDELLEITVDQDIRAATTVNRSVLEMPVDTLVDTSIGDAAETYNDIDKSVS